MQVYTTPVVKLMMQHKETMKTYSTEYDADNTWCLKECERILGAISTEPSQGINDIILKLEMAWEIIKEFEVFNCTKEYEPILDAAIDDLKKIGRM